MLSSISILICLQLYVLPQDERYKQACFKAVEASLISSGLGQDLEKARVKIEDKAKGTIPPALATIPYMGYQFVYKKNLYYHIPHSVITLRGDKTQGQVILTWSL